MRNKREEKRKLRLNSTKTKIITRSGKTSRMTHEFLKERKS